jgi:hypothetical protein
MVTFQHSVERNVTTPQWELQKDKLITLQTMEVWPRTVAISLQEAFVVAWDSAGTGKFDATVTWW